MRKKWMGFYSVLFMSLGSQALVGPNTNNSKVEAVAAQPMNSSDASLANALLGKLLDSIERANIDFEVTGSFSSKGVFKTNSMKAKGVVKFDEDWIVPIISPSSGDKAADKNSSRTSDQFDKVLPLLKVDAKDLIASVDIDRSSSVTAMSLKFYKGYDSLKEQWTTRSLTLSASNQFDKELMRIKLNWVRLKITKPSDSKLPSLIQGTCSSEKELLDITTGEIHPVAVECEFDGTYSDQGYNVNFKYINSDAISNKFMPPGDKP